MPDGKGKELVSGVCSACHQTNMITQSSGYTHDGWKELVGTMIDLKPTPEQQNEITQYLATNFPPNTKRAPKLIPGSTEITFKEWVTPTLGQRSRDPVQADDGSIWWAGQFGNLIGRLDPKTGEMKEYPLPPMAKPHSVWLDDKGMAWYTGNMNGTIGKVDPVTGKVTEYKMPDPAAKDPHTAVFDKKGILWFTLQNSNMVGRLDPATRRHQAGDPRRRRTPSPTASRSTPTALRGSPATGVPAWSRSIPPRWRSPRSSCRSKARPCGASTSPRTA